MNGQENKSINFYVFCVKWSKIKLDKLSENPISENPKILAQAFNCNKITISQ